MTRKECFTAALKMSTELPDSIYDLETPCMLVDIDVVKKNCQRMIDRCQEYGVDLRPHMKTHKTVEGGELMTNGTKKKIVVSTVEEANFFANNGFDDILWASPIVKQRISKRVIDLASNKVFHVMFDTMEGLEGLIQQPLNNGRRWSAFLEIDCGYGRMVMWESSQWLGDDFYGEYWYKQHQESIAGCLYNSDTAVKLAKLANEASNVEFQGLYVHCGNTYQQDPAKRVELQAQTTDRLLELKNRLTEEGLTIKTYGSGSTPSCSKPQEFMKNLTEFHPGNYIFYDYMQVALGSCSFEDVACRVMTTVIDHKPESKTVMIDCGWTAISLDAPESRFDCPLGMAPIQGHPELNLAAMTQELGKLKATEGELEYSKYRLGSRLFLYPYHACATAAMHPIYYIHSGDKIVGTWKPTRGW